jgi:hypothetical protein
MIRAGAKAYRQGLSLPENETAAFARGWEMQRDLSDRKRNRPIITLKRKRK